MKTLTRLTAALAGVVVSATLAAPVTAAPAAPPNAGILAVECQTFLVPALLTGFGPVRICYRYAASPVGQQGQAGYYSLVNGHFEPITGWLAVDARIESLIDPATATDGHTEMVALGTRLMTGYGPASWGVQYRNNLRVSGRFGSYNWITKLFYPAGDWVPVI